MKNYLIALAALLCVTGKLNAQYLQTGKPFQHSPSYHNNPGYAKKAMESLPQQMVGFSWSIDEWDWSKNMDSTYMTYNNSGMVLTEKYLSYYDLNISRWYILTYTYNQAKQLIADYTIEPYEPTEKADTMVKSTYEYDSHGNLTLYSSYSKPDSTWTMYFSRKSINTYDDNDRLSEVIFQYWDDTKYVNREQNIYVYNTEGKINKILILEWNENSNKFDSNSRTTNIIWHKWTTKAENALVQYYEVEEWNGSMFEPSYKNNISYDNHDNITEDKSEKWEDNEWSIRYWWQYPLTYNSNNQLTQRIFKRWDGGALVNLRKELYGDYFMFNGIRDLNKQSTPPLSIYPNPFEEAVTIEIPSYTHSTEMVLVVYDLLGRSVMTQPIEASKTILEKGNLQQGIYTFQLMENNNVTHSGKFLIK